MSTARFRGTDKLVKDARLDRGVWALVLTMSMGILLVARALTPSLHGMGTHEQLGLPPCGFHALFHLPCPACGLTTSFAHLARLHIASAVMVQPLGVPLFLLTVLCVPLSGVGLVRGLSVARLIDRFELDRWALGLVCVLLLSWCARLLASMIA